MNILDGSKRLSLNTLMVTLLITLTLGSAMCFAQSIVGSISGVITDTSGARMAGATVAVVNQATGEARTSSTNSEGAYTTPSLTPGVYNVRVQAKGFQNFSANDVAVTSGSDFRIDARMTLGSESETINVNAASETIQTDSAAVRGLIDSKELANFPIPASRNYESALLLVPGITPPLNSNSLGANPSRGLIFQTNGAFGTANNIRIDGAAAVNVWLPHVAAYNPGLDAVDSVSIVTNSYNPQDGLAGGAAVNVHVRTGSNKFHGSVFEIHTDNALTAEPFFLPPHFTRNPKVVDNAAGGTFGGPILRNKLFFFFSYDGRFVSQNSSTTVTVPTAAMRSGDFSGSPTPIYDPLTGTPTGAGKTAFSGNQILPSRQDSIALAIQQFVPLPNLPVFLTTTTPLAHSRLTIASTTPT